MVDASSLFGLLLLAIQFQIAGQITAPKGTVFKPVQLESIDRKIVKYDDVNKNGKFSFKVPEGLYKITLTTESGRVEHRTVEVRESFADDDGRIPLKIELTDTGTPTEAASAGSAAPPGVSAKAVEELQHANDAKGNARKAREHLEKALAISPNYPEALTDLGKLDVQAKAYSQAVERFQKALSINPEFYPARVNLGGAFLITGDYDRAAMENSKAVEMQPGDSVAQSQLGQALFRLNRNDEALQHLEIAKRIDPMSYTAPGLYIAQIYQARGDYAAALAEYKEFLKTHPGHEFTGSIQNEIIFLEKQTSGK